MKTLFLVHDQQESPAPRQGILEMAGYSVKLFPGSRELFVALRDERPDAIVLDALIEGKNGFETTAEVHAKFPRRDFPIVLCTRIYRARQFREEALRAGAQEFLLLPIEPNLFLERVQKALNDFGSRAEEAA